MKGRMVKAIVVNVRQFNDQGFGVPRANSNQCVLVDTSDKPIGSKILVPVPSILRRIRKCEHICKIAKTFVA